MIMISINMIIFFSLDLLTKTQLIKGNDDHLPLFNLKLGIQ